ncbi:hypothetical protein [Taibaiella koreensis]|uniref:hypothetical protein n=1 Tax=Taibaiella koreensis TaxID=1268548 RepID=UPI000E59F897|nr:hypothetical protein [Taibaiella koreensis]
MILELSLSAPEHAHLIEGYHDFFQDNHIFSTEWPYPALPGIGHSIDEAYIVAFLAGKVNTDMLPHTWTIVDLKWHVVSGSVLPRLYIVGK